MNYKKLAIITSLCLLYLAWGEQRPAAGVAPEPTSFAAAAAAGDGDASSAIPTPPLVSALSPPFPPTPPVAGGRGRARKWAGPTWKPQPPEVGSGTGMGEWGRDPWAAGGRSW